MFSDHSAATLISATEAVGTQAGVPSFHIPISEIGKWRDREIKWLTEEQTVISWSMRPGQIYRELWTPVLWSSPRYHREKETKIKFCFGPWQLHDYRHLA